MKKFITLIITLFSVNVYALPDMRNFPNHFEKLNWEDSYMSKESNFIYLILTKLNNKKFYCGRCIQTGYTIGITYEENLIDSTCMVTHGSSKECKESSGTQYIFDERAKTHLAIFSFDDDDTRVLFLKNNDGTMIAAFQTVANAK